MNSEGYSLFCDCNYPLQHPHTHTHEVVKTSQVKSNAVQATIGIEQEITVEKIERKQASMEREW